MNMYPVKQDKNSGRSEVKNDPPKVFSMVHLKISPSKKEISILDTHPYLGQPFFELGECTTLKDHGVPISDTLWFHEDKATQIETRDGQSLPISTIFKGSTLDLYGNPGNVVFEILIALIVTISSVDKTPTQYTVSAMNWTYDATTCFFLQSDWYHQRSLQRACSSYFWNKT